MMKIPLLVKLLLVSILSVDSKMTKSFNMQSFRKFCSSALIATSLCGFPLISIADESLTDQLRNLQSNQIASTKVRIETEEADSIARALQYPDGFLIGRGIVTLVEDEAGNRNPYGVSDTYIVNADVGKDDATVFLLAVGREGPPLAAKKITNVNSMKFPMVVEITCDDLLFPYTASAYKQSSNRGDTIALTAILSADGKLATASPSDRLGFGQSEPVNIAGVSARTTASLIMNKRIDLSLYSKDEIALLASIDDELDRKAAAPAVDSLAKSAPSAPTTTSK